jgi:hypothetical protein
LWADVDGQRHFSASYYAEVLSDFDVQLVVRCGAQSYDEAAFVRRGMAVEELPVEEAGPHHLLGRIDRFLTLTSFAPGPIALHADGVGLGAAEVLVSAYLIRRHAFLARAAIAWVRMVHPAAHVPGLRFSTHAARPAPPSTQQLARRNTIHEARSAPPAAPAPEEPAAELDRRHSSGPVLAPHLPPALEPAAPAPPQPPASPPPPPSPQAAAEEDTAEDKERAEDGDEVHGEMEARSGAQGIVVAGRWRWWASSPSLLLAAVSEEAAADPSARKAPRAAPAPSPALREGALAAVVGQLPLAGGLPRWVSAPDVFGMALNDPPA